MVQYSFIFNINLPLTLREVVGTPLLQISSACLFNFTDTIQSRATNSPLLLFQSRILRIKVNKLAHLSLKVSSPSMPPLPSSTNHISPTTPELGISVPIQGSKYK